MLQILVSGFRPLYNDIFYKFLILKINEINNLCLKLNLILINLKLNHLFLN